MTPSYIRYMTALQRGATICKWILDDVAGLPLKDIDGRIDRCDKLIKYITELKRDLLFFKNIGIGTNPTLVPPPDDGPGAA